MAYLQLTAGQAFGRDPNPDFSSAPIAAPYACHYNDDQHEDSSEPAMLHHVDLTVTTQSFAAYNQQLLEYAQARLLSRQGITSHFIDQARETWT